MYGDVLTHIAKFLHYGDAVCMSTTCKQWEIELRKYRHKVSQYMLFLCDPRMLRSYRNHLRDELLYMQNFKELNLVRKYFSVPVEYGLHDNYLVLMALLMSHNRHRIHFEVIEGMLVYSALQTQEGLIGCFIVSDNLHKDYSGKTEDLIHTFGRGNRIFYTKQAHTLSLDTRKTLDTFCCGNITKVLTTHAIRTSRCTLCKRNFKVPVTCRKTNPGLGGRCFNKFYKNLNRAYFQFRALTKRSFCDPL